MPERKRSQDGRRETEELFGEPADIKETSRRGGALSADIGSHDEEKLSKERPAGATRVTKSKSGEQGE